MIRADNFGFAYPILRDDASGVEDEAREQTPALSPISFCVREGAFCLLTGLTGCGKTTLLRSMKPELAPLGTYSGTLEVCGATLVSDGEVTGSLSNRESAQTIGFVMQDPDAQIVCDTVWHELAFGLENVGTDPDMMRRRVAEVAHFFGIAPWVERKTDQLSGGQKQLLNLAAVLALRPRLILLDEPTSQLDPAAKRQFIFMLARVQRELGLTVVVATHSPEEMEDFATQTIQILDIGEPAPLSAIKRPAIAATAQERKCVLRARDIYVRHNADDPWVLHGLDLDVQEGTIHAIVGGNGSGKTTLLRALAGDMKPRRGRVTNDWAHSQAFLPQDPKAVFVCDSVAEELREWQSRAGYTDDDIDTMKQRFGLQGMDDRHPYDLSGGQRQNLALAKLLLCKPRLLLLDEPTKGLDAQACAGVVRTLRTLAADGVTVVFATHDLDVAVACADWATLIFDGQAICTQSVPKFFEDNLIWRPHSTSRLYGALQ